MMQNKHKQKYSQIPNKAKMKLSMGKQNFNVRSILLGSTTCRCKKIHLARQTYCTHRNHGSYNVREHDNKHGEGNLYLDKTLRHLPLSTYTLANLL